MSSTVSHYHRLGVLSASDPHCSTRYFCSLGGVQCVVYLFVGWFITIVVVVVVVVVAVIFTV